MMQDIRKRYWSVFWKSLRVSVISAVASLCCACFVDIESVLTMVLVVLAICVADKASAYAFLDRQTQAKVNNYVIQHLIKCQK